MTRRPMASISIALALALAPACKDTGDDTGTSDGGSADGGAADGGAAGEAAVVVSGAVYIAMGDVVTLTATTVNGADGSYTWTSGDDGVATVVDGAVTGVYPGEVQITATGADTLASGSIGLFVQNEIPFYEEWVNSGHANIDAEAFRHWDEDGEVSASCVRCHTSSGFSDYIGADGTAADSVDNGAVPVGEVVECETCHTAGAAALDHVIFPSGVEITGLGGEARCMTCHQGRASGADVDTKIADAGLTDSPDEVSGDLGFTNIHYFPAGATLYAGKVMGGYQYEGAAYDVKFRHVSSRDTCIECHDQHSLELRFDACAECHEGVATNEDTYDIRMMASASVDYDGDGDITEGVYYEIEGIRAQVLASMQAYTIDQEIGNICYAETRYPYWMSDDDGSGGACDDGETTSWASWTPRLLKAAYNYQMATKDPGKHAHNAKYAIELLYDSAMDMNDGLSSPADLSAMTRNDPGHFDGAGEPARHWDGDEEVSSSCSQCHGGAEGLHFYVEYGVGLAGEEPANGLECETCHADIPNYDTMLAVDSVTFPSDVTIDAVAGGGTNNICATCHQGRESKASVDARIASGSYGFRNIHYLPAAAVYMGSEAQVGYEYDGMDYAGPWGSDHLGGEGCVDCHDPVATEHSFDVADIFDSVCATCHRGLAELEDIKSSAHKHDYDGDGNSSESLHAELEGMAEVTYEAMQDYADICYNGGRYPYFFADADGSGGPCGDDETGSFKGWDPALMKAAFNYQMFQKEPGAWAHNFDYMGQLLYDSIDDLMGNTSGMMRP